MKTINGIVWLIPIVIFCFIGFGAYCCGAYRVEQWASDQLDAMDI